MTASIEIQGFDTLLDKLETMSLKMSNVIVKNALTKAGEIEKDAMEAAAPKLTGDMAQSIEVSNIKTKNGIKYVEIRPDKKHFYYTFSELGRNGQAPNPFMARSFAANKAKLKEVIREEVKKGLGL